MHAVAGPRVSAGVALLSAGVVALSPAMAVSTDAHIASLSASVSTAVRLTASTDPLQRWLEVIQTSATNLGAVSQQFFDAPAPILEKIVANQLTNAEWLSSTGQQLLAGLQQSLEAVPAQLQQAAQQLWAGNIVGAVDTFNAALLPPVLNVVFYLPELYKVVANAGQNFANVLAVLPEAVINPVLTLAYPLVSGVNAAAEIAQAVLDAAKAGDVQGVANTLINAPANLINGVLNGAGTILGFLPTPGLLTPYDPTMDFLGSGPIAQFLHARQLIADALKPLTAVPTAAVSAATVAPSNTTLTVAVSSAATTENPSPSPDAVSSDSSEKQDEETSSGSSATTGTATQSVATSRKSAASSANKPGATSDNSSKAGGKSTGGSARHSSGNGAAGDSEKDSAKNS